MYESHHSLPAKSPSKVESNSTRPATLAELLALSRNELASLDIGLMNLLCAQGLRGAETLDVTNYMARLDVIAQRVESETKRHYYQFRNNPAKFEHSEGYFRMLLLAVTLQEDLGMRYNPDRIRRAGDFEENEVFYADSRDVFLHGLIAEDSRRGARRVQGRLRDDHRARGRQPVRRDWATVQLAYLESLRDVMRAWGEVSGYLKSP